MSKFRELNKGTIQAVLSASHVSKRISLSNTTSGSVVLYYYGEFDAMTNDSDENALAAVVSDLIIYGGLTYASDYYLDERTIFEQFTQFLTEPRAVE